MHADSVDIEFDPKKADSNFKKHGVSFDEATTSFLDPMALAQEDSGAQGEARWVLLGVASSGRLLAVCYTLRRDDTIRLISARKATAKEKQQYAQGI